GRQPTDAEISARSEIDLADIEKLRDMARTVTSLDRPVGESGEAAFGDLLPSDALAPDEEVVVSLREAAVRRALASLPTREREVVALRYGLDDDAAPIGVQEIGRRLGLR